VTAALVDIRHGGRTLSIEYVWVQPARASPEAPVVVFLHEGLGSVALWRDYPQRLCDAGGYRGLVFSRPGYGRSTPRPPGERWPVTFMHDQAELLPMLLARLGIAAASTKPWLFGHSDGGSIALIHAAMRPDDVAGIIAVAPHIIVEDLSLRSIAKARDDYLATDLRERLSRYHDDVDSAFWGWNDVWLSPEFRTWSIEPLLSRLRCPILAVQGADDEYGTLAQVEGIRRSAAADVLVLPACGHSPHRDAPDALTKAVVQFITRHSTAPISQGGVQ
jgi:pimeloyl-ACP methyl ester carboxylesterase